MQTSLAFPLESIPYFWKTYPPAYSVVAWAVPESVHVTSYSLSDE